MNPVEVKLKSPYRVVEGESPTDRAKRIHRESALRSRWRKALAESRGASRERVAEAMVELDAFARSQADKDWEAVNWDTYSRLSRQVTFQANKWRARKRCVEVKNNMRNAGMID